MRPSALSGPSPFAAVPFAVPLLSSEGNGQQSNFQGAAMSARQSTNIAVGVASTAVWAGAASSEFNSVTIVNDSPNTVYLNVLGSAAVMGAGVRLNAEGGTYTANNQNIFGIAGIASKESNITLTVA